MFYLMAFLSLLVGVLVYMMDPAPMDLRHSMDVRTAEVFVAPFFNQHQAAKDYLKFWLGKVYPGELNVNQTWNGSSVSNGFTNNASIISLPVAFENFMPFIISERHGTNTFSQLTSVGGTGYVSALVCMDSNGDLTPCYNYTCSDFSVNIPCSGGSTILRLNPASAKRYLITYGMHRGALLPGNHVPTAQEKAYREDLWVTALARRSRGTGNCGFLMPAPPTGGGSPQKWCYNPAFTDDRRVQVCGAAGDADYCINNGNRCMSVLPPAIQNYLTRVVPGGNVNLDKVLFCISETGDLYEKISPTTFHYDGIDYLGLGAEKGRDTLGGTWYPVSGTIGDSSVALPSSNLNQLLTLPITQVKGDFTLSFVMEDTANGDAGPLVNTSPVSNPHSLYSLEVRAGVVSGIPKKEFHFFPSETLGIEAWVKDETGVDKQTYAWTIMRRKDTMYLFLNGCQVQDSSGQKCWPARANASAVEPLDPITFGPLGIGAFSGRLKDVRYYSHALTGLQLKRSFELDMTRYGVLATTCTGGLADIPEVDYPPCH